MRKALLLSLFLFSTSFVHSQWTDNTYLNTPVCTAANDQTFCSATTDGAGGAIIAWQDDRAGGYKVYAQRMNTDGVAQWTTNGKLIYSQDNGNLEPSILSDGVGGAFILWSRSQRIFAQHINGAGTELWVVNGKEIASDYGVTDWNAIEDGSGGFFISYYKQNIIYGQHINAAGNKLWDANDITLCNAMYRGFQKMLSDGSGGFIIAWANFTGSTRDIYAQRFNAAGVAQWGINGVAVQTSTLEENYPEIVTDGAGGAIITWELHEHPQHELYAQRINAAGITQWPTAALITTTCSADAGVSGTKSIADNEGGIITTWTDQRLNTPPIDYSNPRAYTQHLDAQGTALWIQNGIPIKTVAVGANPQYSAYPYINGDGFIYYTFLQVYNFSSGFTWLYAQKLDQNGDLLWDPNGIPMCTHNFSQTWINMLPDNAGGIITSFRNDRDDADGDIIVQNIHSDGTLGRYLGTDSFNANENVTLYPNPTTGKFSIDASVPLDKIIVVDVLGQEILNVVPVASNTSFQLDHQAKGVYFVKLISQGKQTVKKLLLQ